MSLGDDYTKVYFNSNRECKGEFKPDANETSPEDVYLEDPDPSSLQFFQVILSTIIGCSIISLILLNLFELIAMWYLISTQRKRTLGQILYDFNHETLSDTLSKLRYRRNEVVMRNLMIILFLLVLITNCAIGLESFFQYGAHIHLKISLAYVSVIFLLQTLYFFSLMVTMKKLHNHEYKRVRNQMVVY